MTRALLVLAALMATASAASAPPGPGPTASTVLDTQRWILTPAQRAAIERARRAGAADDAEGGYSGPWRMQGLVQSQQTAGSAWVNGQLVRAGERIGDQVWVRAVRPDRVILEIAGRLITLRPGQMLQPDGQVSDLLTPQPAAPALAAPMLKDFDVKRLDTPPADRARPVR